MKYSLRFYNIADEKELPWCDNESWEKLHSVIENANWQGKGILEIFYNARNEDNFTQWYTNIESGAFKSEDVAKEFLISRGYIVYKSGENL